MTGNLKGDLVKQIQDLEAQGRHLASLSDPNFRAGHASWLTVAVARQHVAVTTKRRELASVIRREAGLA